MNVSCCEMLNMTARDLRCVVCNEFDEQKNQFVPVHARYTEVSNVELSEKLQDLLGVRWLGDEGIILSICMSCYTLLNDIDFFECKLKVSAFSRSQVVTSA